MRGFVQLLAKFLKAENGLTEVEWAMILALLIVVCLSAMNFMVLQNKNAGTKFYDYAYPVGTGS